MICKFCGMESTTTDRCSFCGQTLTATAEASPASLSEPVVETPPAEEAIPAAPAAEGVAPAVAADLTAEMPAAGMQPTVAMKAMPKANMPRPPAPAIVPRPSDRIGRMPVPITPPARATPPSLFDPPPAQPEPPPVSLSDPLAEHRLYMENTSASPAHAPLLNAEVAPMVTDMVADMVTDMGAGTVADAPVAAALTPEVVPPVAPVDSRLPAEPPVTAPTATMRSAGRDRPGKKRSVPTLFSGVPTVLLGRYTIALLLVLLVVAALANIGPQYSAIPLCVGQFIGAMLLPVMRLVPWADEDSDDLFLFILLTLVFGPVVSLVIYIVLGLMRQTVNPGIVGCMTVAALTRLVVSLAAREVPAAHVIAQTMPLAHLDHLDIGLIKMLLKDWAGMLALAGWFAAGVFHKLDE